MASKNDNIRLFHRNDVHPTCLTDYLFQHNEGMFSMNASVEFNVHTNISAKQIYVIYLHCPLMQYNIY